MKLSSVLRSACAVTAVALLSTSCGGSGESNSAPATPQSGALAGICPEKVVVQTDWFPEAEHGGTDQVQYTDNEEGVEVGDLATRTDAIAEGGDVGKQDQALFVHGLVKGEVTHLKQHHGSGPEDHQAGVGHVGAE